MFKCYNKSVLDLLEFTLQIQPILWRATGLETRACFLLQQNKVPCSSSQWIKIMKSWKPVDRSYTAGGWKSLCTHAEMDDECDFLMYLPTAIREPTEENVLVAQSHLTLCNRMDCSPPGSSVHVFLQARNWSGKPFPSPGDLPDRGIKPRSSTLQADSLPSEPPEKPQGNQSPPQSLSIQYWQRK